MVRALKRSLLAFARDAQGTAALEYSIALMLIIVVIIGGWTAVEAEWEALLTHLTTNIDDAL